MIHLNDISCYFLLTLLFFIDKVIPSNRNDYGLLFIKRNKGETHMEKQDLSSAYRRLKSPNIKTRKRALKIIKEHKRNKQKKSA